jgi:hypothetical protein
MSGIPKPQAPKLFKGKLKVTVSLLPKPEPPQAAELTVLPSGEKAKAEDTSPPPQYEGLAPRRSMFSGPGAPGASGPVGSAAPGLRRKLTVAERLRAPLMAAEEESSDLEEEVEVPPVKVPEVAVPREVIPFGPPAPRPQPQLPPVAKELLGFQMKPKKKSYSLAAVKQRFTDEIAETLIEVGKQLQESKIAGLDLDEGLGLLPGETLADGRMRYVFDNDAQFADGPHLSDAKLQALDDLFPSLRIRMNSIEGDGSLKPGSKDPIAIDYAMLLSLIAYADEYQRTKPKIKEQQRKQAIRDLLTDEIADTLVELEVSLTTLASEGKGLQTMTETAPSAPGQPHVYSFTDGTTFLPTDGSPEAKKRAEIRLSLLTPLFPGGTKIGVTSLTGRGPFDTEGTPLSNDIQFLTELFAFAKQYKQRAEKRGQKQAEKVEALEAARAKTLEGTPFEAFAKPIEDELSKAPYEVTTTSPYTPGTYDDKKKKPTVIPQQIGFIPQTRRAFGYFIYDKYRRYMLKAMDKLDPNACQAMGDSSSATQIYEYQKFVRDYISFMTPYRGVLVYHGLGSGKTCTAIAASEALLSSGGKKRIIVMTPFSLRKNFIQQITFCGFRHFRLTNYWTPHDYKASDGQNALWLFATSVMEIPAQYLAARRGKPLRIWIPDLTAANENYSKLDGTAQAEIRQQIYETIVYDPKKGKHGKIWFLNYNGIPATTLKDMACQDKEVFDNAVIVIDEIHNLVRLMQGTVDPYLKKIAIGDADADPSNRDPDRITSDKWHPKYCGRTMNYKRGYLFYRLLLQAKNTKIVGLSGTPLINFPEELGILANLLHGYTFLYSTSLEKVNEAGGNKRIEDGLKQMAEGSLKEIFCPELDFYEVVSGDRQAKIEFRFTFLPEGYRKIQGQLGVERIPEGEPLESVEVKLAKVKECILKVVKTVSRSYPYDIKFKETPEPLLPVMGEPSFPAKQMDDSFKGRFLGPDGISLVNEQVLLKRLNGLISYYKGSRKDLMPEVTEDTVVQVPMSLDQQRKYIAIRLQEIKIEQKQKERRGDGGEGKGDDAELKKLSSSQNYRMASRQACNFVFPDGFTRPRPTNAREALAANELGGSLEMLMGGDEAPEASALVGTVEEEAAISSEEERAAKEVAQEDLPFSELQEQTEIAAKRDAMKGKPSAEIEAAVKEIRDTYATGRAADLVLVTKEEAEGASGEVSAEQKLCLENQLEGETYQEAMNRSKQCLRKFGLPKLALVDREDPSRPSPLGKWSPKYKAMIEKILELNGSSLVYSQFLGMEGIGIFTIAMEANGFVPIKIVSQGGQFVFDEATEASLRKGPSDPTPRFILFTGGEQEEIRKVNIDLFNAKLGELPPRIRQVLDESGFTEAVGNKKGELCRVFCITAAGAEGLSLKNVRGVQIMEPYWNDVRMAQVKGRAVRICSHQELPLKERTVRIFTYVTVFDRLAQDSLGNARENDRMKWAIPQEIWNKDSLTRAEAEALGLRVSSTKGEYAMTSDERLYYISERKKKLVANLTVILKTAAADCLLNYKENRDGTYICRLLGNEGDFLYHPNLQRDIETSRNDDIGDLFKVPEKEIERIKAENAKLKFEDETEAKEEEVAPAQAAVPGVKAAPPPPAPVAVPAAPQAQKRIKYKVAIKGKEYVITGIPDASGTLDEFGIYELADTAFARRVGKAGAEYDAAKKRWIPKKDSAVLGAI